MKSILLAAAAAAVAAPATSLPPGFWQSEGYGWLLEVRAGQPPLLRHLSREGCIPDQGDGPIQELASQHVARWDRDGAGATTFNDENVTRFHFERLAKLPAICRGDWRSPDPVLNFEALWEAFNEHYAFFAERGVDWFRTYEKFRPQVTPRTTPDELYRIMTEMLGSLDDRHVTLQRPGAPQFRAGLGPVVSGYFSDYAGLPTGNRPELYAYVLGRLQPFKDRVDRRYLEDRQTDANGIITWGRIGDLGYLRIDEESRLAGDDASYADQLRVLQKALDRAIGSFAGSRAVILDLRFNLGGSDGLSLAAASRFTDSGRLGFVKAARAGGGWTPPQSLVIPRSPGPTFTGPVYLLSSNVTVSAGENLVLATMSFPNVLRVGETTAGAHSDQLMKPLPNGWVTSISNERFSGADGIVREGRGIAPDVTIGGTFDSPEGGGRDPVIGYVVGRAHGGYRSRP